MPLFTPGRLVSSGFGLGLKNLVLFTWLHCIWQNSMLDSGTYTIRCFCCTPYSRYSGLIFDGWWNAFCRVLRQLVIIWYRHSKQWLGLYARRNSAHYFRLSSAYWRVILTWGSVRLSVCLSVTDWYCVKMVVHNHLTFSPHVSFI